jgi:hypothetical protein
VRRASHPRAALLSRRSLAALLTCLSLTATAHAAQTVKLHATLTPERLGQGTTIGFGFQITGPDGLVPSPLTQVSVSYPASLQVALSGLGLASCSTETLENQGPNGCPAESLMGYGNATAEIPFGPNIVHETAHVTLLRAPVAGFSLTFYAEAAEPVNAQLTFPGQLLEAQPPYGGAIHIDIPPLPSFPAGPDVALVNLNSTIGPQHITYYEHHHGHWTAYHPQGILLPHHCPHEGFPFAATLTFLDGTQTNAETTVPCPSGMSSQRLAKPRRDDQRGGGSPKGHRRVGRSDRPAMRSPPAERSGTPDGGRAPGPPIRSRVILGAHRTVSAPARPDAGQGSPAPTALLTALTRADDLHRTPHVRRAP